MKTLQEQYNLINEGKGRKDLFMKSARRLFPNLIDNVTPYNTAVTILKNRQVLSESTKVLGITNVDPFASFNSFLNEEAKAIEKAPTKEVTDLETAGYDYKNPRLIDNVYGEAFLLGYYAEMKDPKNAEKSVDELKEIVAKNLAKDKTYYATNQAFGIKGIGYSVDHPGLGPTKEVKGKFASSGMEPVKIKENMIKLTDLLSENYGYEVDEAENKEEKEAHYRDAEKDDAAHIRDLEDDMKDDKKKEDKIKKEDLMSRLKEIETAGNVAALEAKMNAIDEEVMHRQAKLDMVSENEALAEFINPSRVNEIKREIKELEKAKAKYKKLYEKATGSKKKEVVDEADETEE